MKTLRFRLTLDVEFDPQGETAEDLRRRMHSVVKDAVNNGILTGDSGATVEHYNFEIKQLPRMKLTYSVEFDETIKDHIITLRMHNLVRAYKVQAVSENEAFKIASALFDAEVRRDE